jgi:NADPH2:quinone reductase
VKNITVIGLYWGYYMGWAKQRPDSAQRARVRGLFEELFALFEKGLLHPLVDAALPLADFAEGMRRVEQRVSIGKVILRPGE